MEWRFVLWLVDGRAPHLVQVFHRSHNSRFTFDRDSIRAEH